MTRISKLMEEVNIEREGFGRGSLDLSTDQLLRVLATSSLPENVIKQLVKIVRSTAQPMKQEDETLGFGSIGSAGY